MRKLLQELIEVKEESGIQFELEEDNNLDSIELKVCKELKRMLY